MANYSQNVDEALAGMAKTGGPRVPIGYEATEGASYPSADTGNQKLMPRGNVQAGDPTAGEPPAARTQVKYQGANRMGARYGISVNTVIPNAPEAGATQANGRVIPPQTIRSRNSFDDGVGTSYL